jgi:membrane protease YdiL (CAAX protease family)
MLLIMLPLIALASTQSDFLHKYPTFALFTKGNTFDSTLTTKLFIYEILYGSDYIAIELFFRGFALYILSRFIGKGAIIPLAAMYVFIHFGKPVGETISSFFGGIILGVVAYETKSIIGGIIVHCGIAYMMETGGFIGNLF